MASLFNRAAITSSRSGRIVQKRFGSHAHHPTGPEAPPTQEGTDTPTFIFSEGREMNRKPLSSGMHQEAQAHSPFTGVNLYLFPSILTILMSVCHSDLGFTSGGFKLALTAVVGLIAWSRIDEHLTSQGEVGKQEKDKGNTVNRIKAQDTHF